MIDAIVPRGYCINCAQARADFSLWLCGGCAVGMRRNTEPSSLLDGVAVDALYRYEGPLGRLLSRAKNPLEPALYDWLLEASSQAPQHADFVPVPTPWRRRFKRRGCHTTYLAQQLAKIHQGQVVHALRRRHHGTPQADLPAAQRRMLADDTFQCVNRTLGEQVVLVDDVLTTGTTLRTAINALKPQCDAQKSALSAVVLGRVF